MGRAFRSLTTAVLLAAAAPLAAGAADRGVAEEILARAVESYRSGNYEPAIGGINAALRGGLSSAQTAQALYYRGLAHRKQGRPGYAVSDLSRALDYDALSDAERSEAMEARSAAYQEAGIADQETVVVAAPVGDRRGDTDIAPVAGIAGTRLPEIRQAVTTATIIPPPVAPPAAAKWGGSTQVAMTAPLPAPAPSQAAKPAVPNWSSATQTAATVQPAVAQPPPATPSAKPAAPGWFSTANVAVTPLPPVVAPKAGKPASKENARASVAPPRPVEKPAASKRAESTWSSVTAPAPMVAAAVPPPSAKPLAPFLTQVAAVVPEAPPMLPPTAPLAAPAPAAPAEFRLLVGETRSRGEAFALAIRLTSQRGSGLGPRKPQIAAGTMADVVVYRVRLGPFADAGAAQALCGSLRSSGYPCILE